VQAGVGDATILKTLTVFRAILKRAERDREIDRNPIPLVAKPKHAPKRARRGRLRRTSSSGSARSCSSRRSGATSAAG
jgi:hypothetical protein